MKGTEPERKYIIGISGEMCAIYGKLAAVLDIADNGELDRQKRSTAPMRGAGDRKYAYNSPARYNSG